MTVQVRYRYVPLHRSVRTNSWVKCAAIGRLGNLLRIRPELVSVVNLEAGSGGGQNVGDSDGKGV